MKIKTLGVSAMFLLTFGVAPSFAQDDSSMPPPRDTSIFASVLKTVGMNVYIGVLPEEISKKNFSAYNLNEVRGVGVKTVVEDSPASKAGLLKGDVITEFNNEKVTSVAKLHRLIRETAPDHQAELTVIRNGGETKLTVTMGSRQTSGDAMTMFPAMEMMPPMPPFGADIEIFEGDALPKDGGKASKFISQRSYYLGVRVVPVSAQLAKHLGDADGKGLMISEVSENSPAAKAGLKVGDIILNFDEKILATNADLIQAVNAKKDAESNVTFLRDGRKQTLKIKAEPRQVTTEQRIIVRKVIENGDVPN